jgi:hypothetical protein
MKNPFEVIKFFFNSKWEDVSTYEKSRNFFMINRICSIQFPVQSNYFNNIKISPSSVVDYWKVLLSNKYNSPPKWTWTKTRKKEKENKEKQYNTEILDFIKERYQMSNREVSELKDFFPVRFKEFYSEIEELLS